MTNIDFIKKQVTAAINIQKQFNFYKKIARFRSFPISKRYHWKSRWSTNWTHCQTSKEYEAIAKRKEAIVKSIEEQINPRIRQKKYSKVLIYRN
jgi:uncharacterized protein